MGSLFKRLRLWATRRDDPDKQPWWAVDPKNFGILGFKPGRYFVCAQCVKAARRHRQVGRCIAFAGKWSQLRHIDGCDAVAR